MFPSVSSGRIDLSNLCWYSKISWKYFSNKNEKAKQALVAYLQITKQLRDMNKVAIILLMAVGIQANAQRIIKATNFIVVMSADTISIKQAFESLKVATPVSRFY